jgi:hypothetical protein
VVFFACSNPKVCVTVILGTGAAAPVHRMAKLVLIDKVFYHALPMAMSVLFSISKLFLVSLQT